MREDVIGRQQVINMYSCPLSVVNKFTGEMSRAHCRVCVDEANGEWPCHKISLRAQRRPGDRCHLRNAPLTRGVKDLAAH